MGCSSLVACKQQLSLATPVLLLVSVRHLTKCQANSCPASCRQNGQAGHSAGCYSLACLALCCWPYVQLALSRAGCQKP